jgi:hypothetical protein
VPKQLRHVRRSSVREHGVIEFIDRAEQLTDRLEGGDNAYAVGQAVCQRPLVERTLMLVAFEAQAHIALPGEGLAQIAGGGDRQCAQRRRRQRQDTDVKAVLGHHRPGLT